MADESAFLHHGPCAECGSSDANAFYDDGHTHCFSCGVTKAGDSAPSPKRGRMSKSKTEFVQGEVQALTKRGITAETCEKWGYKVGRHHDRPVQIANYISDGKIVAQKIRYPDKTFEVVGDGKSLPLYGQHLWRDGGKSVTVTEGEIDALTMSQLFGNKWPVVSVPNGAQGAKKSIKKALPWLEQFESVIFMFDNDEPGQEAARECALLLTPGKAKIATLPLKDANEMLQAGRGKEVIDAFWGAKVYRPDGIISGDEIKLADLLRAVPPGFTTRYPLLNEKLNGLRKGELTLLTAGTGVGKSTLAREIAAHMIQSGMSTGNVYLEESYTKTAQGYIAIDRDIPLGHLRCNPGLLTPEQYEESFKRMIANGRTYFYNHFGSLESENLLAKLHYFATGLDVDYIFLDHISIVVSGQESSREGERKDIDILMTKLRQLIEQTGVGVIAICHLKMVEGKPHEEGGRVTLSHLRGSGTLKQLSDNIVALERDQQGDDPDESLIRVLKCREFGRLGPADTLKYSHETGRLLPFEEPEFGDETAMAEDKKEDF